MTTEERRRFDDLEAWRSAYERIRPQEAGPCPGDEVLAALVLGEPSPEARRELADHVVACPSCRQRWEILRALHREADGLRSGRRRPISRLLLAVAASVVVAGSIIAFLVAGDFGREGEAPVVRGAALEARVQPSPEVVLAAPPSQLAWPSRDDDRASHVRLFDADGEVLWETTSSGDSTDLPEAVRSRLEPGRSYFWVVDQGPGRRLGPYWFTLE